MKAQTVGRIANFSDHLDLAGEKNGGKIRWRGCCVVDKNVNSS